MTSKGASQGGKRSDTAHTRAPSQRQLRVAEEVRHALAALFERRDFRDPDLASAHVTVTEVRASPDLRHMTAFVSGLGKDLPSEQLAALKRAAPFLRTQLVKSVRLRFAPSLHFQSDTALAYAMQIDQLMRRPEIAQDLQRKPAAGRTDDQEADDTGADDTGADDTGADSDKDGTA